MKTRKNYRLDYSTVYNLEQLKKQLQKNETEIIQEAIAFYLQEQNRHNELMEEIDRFRINMQDRA